MLVLVIWILLAVPIATVAAESGNPGGMSAQETDPIRVTPDQTSLDPTSRKVVVTVSAIDVPAARRPTASLIVYKPDGTMLQFRSKALRQSSARFRIRLGRVAQVGTYTVYGTVCAGSDAFGMATTFDVATD